MYDMAQAWAWATDSKVTKAATAAFLSSRFLAMSSSSPANCISTSVREMNRQNKLPRAGAELLPPPRPVEQGRDREIAALDAHLFCQVVPLVLHPDRDVPADLGDGGGHLTLSPLNFSATADEL